MRPRHLYPRLNDHNNRIRGVTTHSLVERSLDALLFELRSWPAAADPAGSAPAPAPIPTPPSRPAAASSSVSSHGTFEEDYTAAGVRVSAIGSGNEAGGGTRGRGRASPLSSHGPGVRPGEGAGTAATTAGGGGNNGNGGGIRTSQLYPPGLQPAMAPLPPQNVPMLGAGTGAPATSAAATATPATAYCPPEAAGAANGASGGGAAGGAALCSPSFSSSSSPSSRQGQGGAERNKRRRMEAAQHGGAAAGPGAVTAAANGATAAVQSAAAAGAGAGVAAGAAAGGGAEAVNALARHMVEYGSRGNPGASNEAWDTLRHSLDFWNWTLTRLSG